ncbi:MAG: response regulator [Candidatus Omnitrophica bacterium]|nr:response regulator [Candidatus Omnitrophota bacterium]
MDSPVILLIDDDKDLTDLLKLRLEANGYSVVVAYDGVEALEKLKKMSPSIIILDVGMPRMDGFEFYRHITTTDGRPRFPVLILTGKDHFRALFKDMAADGFLPKPFEAKQLLAEIEKILAATSNPVVFLFDYIESPRVRGIITALTRERFTVINVESVLAMQNKAKDKKPDFILMEYMREQKDGETFIKEIKENPFLQNIPIIVYSYSGFAGLQEKSLGAGADKYLGKPENYQKFVQALNELRLKR